MGHRAQQLAHRKTLRDAAPVTATPLPPAINVDFSATALPGVIPLCGGVPAHSCVKSCLFDYFQVPSSSQEFTMILKSRSETYMLGQGGHMELWPLQET